MSGAGIAGPALCWWLHRFGFAPRLVETAPAFRDAGYMIDFWGKGYDIVERMGLLPEVLRRGYRVREVRFVDADGNRAGGFSVAPLAAATDGRLVTLARGDLASIIWNALPAEVGTRFGDEIARIEQAADGVRVHFVHAAPEEFDLVIGADGLHSRVRRLLFGPSPQHGIFLDCAFAAFTVAGYKPRDDDVYVSHGIPGRQAARFAMRGDRTMILLLWREPEKRLPGARDEQVALLRERFAAMAWECPQMLEALDRAGDLYLDPVSQIELDRWSRGRVGLLGDAAWAPSFLAGEGAGLAILGAYVLAGELARSGGDAGAFAAYEARLRGLMQSKQKTARGLAGAFVPRTRLGVAFRNLVASSLDIPFVARLAFARTLRDDLSLPDYERPNSVPVYSMH